ncbi:MAG: hypothetical protein ABFD81_18070 [Syntrophaceae bacterium]
MDAKITMDCSWCGAPMEVPENTPKESSSMCPVCAQNIRQRLHGLRNAMQVYVGKIALSDDPDEARSYVGMLQGISDTMAKDFGGISVDVLDIIRKGQGWARGIVRMNCLKLGIIQEQEERRAA